MPALSSSENVSQALRILEKRIDEQSRRTTPTPFYCTAVLNADSTFSGTLEYYAAGGVSAYEDPYGAFHLGTTSPSDPSYIELPSTGRYVINSHITANNSCGTRVFVNAHNSDFSNFFTAQTSPTWGGRRYATAYYEGKFNAGDKLYWSLFLAGNGVVHGNGYPTLTYITVRKIL